MVGWPPSTKIGSVFCAGASLKIPPPLNRGCNKVATRGTGSNPDSVDLYFQGSAWLNRGWTPDNVAQARVFFDRALVADPDNVDAIVLSAVADAIAGADSFVTDPMAALATAEAKLTKALSSAPDHALGHMLLGFVDIMTKRAVEGIAECEHALALDRNSPSPTTT